MRPLDSNIKTELDQHLEAIGTELDSDVIAVVSPILHGLERDVRDAVELLEDRKSVIAIVLETNGGIVEVVERMVTTIRHYYDEVYVIVPDRAMSAGTIFALSADQIFMDYFSVLGPIDPQVERDGRLVPALSFVNEFDRLNEKAASGELTTAEYGLLDKLDLGELYQFRQAMELSIELLENWLSSYKFKDWTVTESSQQPVDDETRKRRAKEIAEALNAPDRWHSHGRGITRDVLRDEINLKIDDLESRSALQSATRAYCDLLRDYMQRQDIYSFVHSANFFGGE